MTYAFPVLLLLQFCLCCIFITGLLIPAARLLGQGKLEFRRSLQCGIGIALFQLVSALLFGFSALVIRNGLLSPDVLRLALLWVALPLLFIAPVLISFTTGWRRFASITSSTVLTLGWAGLQYALGLVLIGRY